MPFTAFPAPTSPAPRLSQAGAGEAAPDLLGLIRSIWVQSISREKWKKYSPPPKKKSRGFFSACPLWDRRRLHFFLRSPGSRTKIPGGPGTSLRCALRCTENAPGSAGEALRHRSLNTGPAEYFIPLLSHRVCGYCVVTTEFFWCNAKKKGGMKIQTEARHWEAAPTTLCGPLWLWLQEDEKIGMKNTDKQICMSGFITTPVFLVVGIFL